MKLQSAFKRVLRTLWSTLDTFRITDKELSLVQNRVNKDAFFFPYGKQSKLNSVQTYLLRKGYIDHLSKKYFFDQLENAKFDTFIDCGGFIGGVSIAANQRQFSQIHYIEPTPITSKCAKLNFTLHNALNVRVHQIALGDRKGSIELNLSRSMSDNSILTPDSSNLNKAILVSMHRLDDFLTTYSVNDLTTYVKVEAEGLEFEIIKGLGDRRPKAIVIDVSPERGGKSPEFEIRELLKEKGYCKFKKNKQCLFATY